MVGTHVDIHKRKETEAKLEELLRSKAERAEALADERAAELAMLHTAVEQSPVSIVITDERGTIRYVNPFFCRLTGYAQDELVGVNPRILKSGVHDAPFYSEMWATLLSGRTWRGEICNRRKDGSLYWEEAIISPVIGRDGAITNFIGVKEDVSARREAARLRDELDAVLRHDLKNPLNVIINIPELLAAEPSMNDDQRESLGLIRDAGLLMLSVMNRSFIVHKIERGSYPYKPAMIDLGAAVMKATAFMRRLHADEGIAIEASVEPGPLFIKGDETLVDQMIVNLLDNALDSSVRGSSVSIRAYRRDEGTVELAISHKAALGKGAAATYLEKRSDQGSAAHPIGRYGARLMARLMGGDAFAAEEPGPNGEPQTVVTASLPSSGRGHGRS
jgi:PAS domain S-box-containing protein